MAMMTGREYIESLRALRPEVYFLGQRIKNIVDEPMFQPHLHAAAMTYELAHHLEGSAGWLKFWQTAFHCNVLPGYLHKHLAFHLIGPLII